MLGTVERSLRSSTHELQSVGGSASGAPSIFFPCETTALPRGSAGEAVGGKPAAVSCISLPLESVPRCLGGWMALPHQCYTLKLLK